MEFPLRADEDETKATIAGVYQESGYLADPHTAVGIHAARSVSRNTPVVVLATAHPAKFPDAVKAASGVTPVIPPHHKDLFNLPEKLVNLPNDIEAVKNYITGNL